MNIFLKSFRLIVLCQKMLLCLISQINSGRAAAAIYLQTSVYSLNLFLSDLTECKQWTYQKVSFCGEEPGNLGTSELPECGTGIWPGDYWNLMRPACWVTTIYWSQSALCNLPFRALFYTLTYLIISTNNISTAGLFQKDQVQVIICPQLLFPCSKNGRRGNKNRILEKGKRRP